MLIKAADGKSADIETLEAFLVRPNLAPATAERIRTEIRTMSAGAKAEADAAYQIDFYCRDSPNVMAIHDLRLEHQGRVAQIDHLIINRGSDIWVCESKSFAEGVSINEHGEWCAYHGGRARGIASPIEQNKRHILVLRDVFERGLVPLPKRLGITIKPDLHSLILVSSSARITRPKSGAPVDGLESVIKCDQLMTTIDKAIDERIMKSVMKVIGRETLENLARSIAALHKPLRTDWEARFGLSRGVEGARPQENERTPSESARKPAAKDAVDQCGSCSGPVTAKVADYCRANTAKFGGRFLCWDCQRTLRAAAH